MPEYHRLKGNTPSLDFFKTPELAAQAAIDAQRILGVDAAIMFADLLPIIEPLGFELDYLPQVGPVIGNPIKSTQCVTQIPHVCAEEHYGYISKTVQYTNEGLPPDIPLLGFSGAPFTLASYLLEGGSSKLFLRTKEFMYNHEASWHELLAKLVDTLVDYLQIQIRSGVKAIQIFDTWIGCLSIADFERYVSRHLENLFEKLANTVPTIYFGTGNSHLCKDVSRLGMSLLALDWRTPLSATWLESGLTAVQGNLDPAILLTNQKIIQRESQRILQEIDNRPGHIFNLGHGIMPTTPVDHVKFLVDFVHETTSNRAT